MNVDRRYGELRIAPEKMKQDRRIHAAREGDGDLSAGWLP
jgi:hypothetical protein